MEGGGLGRSRCAGLDGCVGLGFVRLFAHEHADLLAHEHVGMFAHEHALVSSRACDAS